MAHSSSSRTACSRNLRGSASLKRLQKRKLSAPTDGLNVVRNLIAYFKIFRLIKLNTFGNIQDRPLCLSMVIQGFTGKVDIFLILRNFIVIFSKNHTCSSKKLEIKTTRILLFLYYTEITVNLYFVVMFA